MPAILRSGIQRRRRDKRAIDGLGDPVERYRAVCVWPGARGAQAVKLRRGTGELENVLRPSERKEPSKFSFFPSLAAANPDESAAEAVADWQLGGAGLLLLSHTRLPKAHDIPPKFPKFRLRVHGIGYPKAARRFAGMVISNRDPRPGFDSSVSSPPIEATHSRVTNGPFPLAASSD